MKTPDKVAYMKTQILRLKGQIALLLAKIKLYLYLSHLEFNYRFIDQWMEDAEDHVEHTLEQIKQGGITKAQEQKILILIKAVNQAAKLSNTTPKLR